MKIWEAVKVATKTSLKLRQHLPKRLGSKMETNLYFQVLELLVAGSRVVGMLKGSGITSCFGISKTNSTSEPEQCSRGLAGAIICGASALLPKLHMQGQPQEPTVPHPEVGVLWKTPWLVSLAASLLKPILPSSGLAWGWALAWMDSCWKIPPPEKLT